MSTVYVQFTDATKTKIGAVFASPQNADEHPNYAEIDSSDTERYALYTAFMENLVNPFGL